jgi:hypothetical protein
MKLVVLFLGMLLSLPAFGRKPKTLMSKPASRPPVYKKFNHKEKKPTMRLGVPGKR